VCLYFSSLMMPWDFVTQTHAHTHAHTHEKHNFHWVFFVQLFTQTQAALANKDATIAHLQGLQEKLEAENKTRYAWYPCMVFVSLQNAFVHIMYNIIYIYIYIYIIHILCICVSVRWESHRCALIGFLIKFLYSNQNFASLRTILHPLRSLNNTR
jgi:hypothetical protein